MHGLKPRRGGNAYLRLAAAGCMAAAALPVFATSPRDFDLTELNLERPHPRIVAALDEVAALRERVDVDPWAGAVRDALMAAADALVAEPLDVPRSGGQWTHWYTASDGTRLVPEGPDRHVHPETGAVYSGWPYDAVYVGMQHGRWLRGVQTLGMAYALTQEERYAGRARAILLAYASFYRDLPRRNRDSVWTRGGGKLFAQTLDEAVVLCHVAAGYDLVYAAVAFSAADHRAIEEGLLRPMVRVIGGNSRGMSNWQAWHNAAMGLTGVVLGDRGLVARALNGRHGLAYQLERSVMPSGMWYEPAVIYHWYALNAIVYLAEAMARCGVDVYARPQMRGLFTGPLRQLLPDGTFAPLHDSDRLTLADDRWLLEVAYGRYGDAALAAAAGPRPVGEALTHRSEMLPESRVLGLEAAALTLFWGAKDWPLEAAAPVGASSPGPGEGLAVLRTPLAGLVALLSYAPKLAGHTQRDRLNLVVYAHGDIRFADAGRGAYGHPLQQSWYGSTVAHNTVVVDEGDQEKAGGRLVAFEPDATLPAALAARLGQPAEPGWTHVHVACDGAYRGVRLERRLWLRGDVLIDQVECRAERTREFDLPLHVRGRLLGLVAREADDTGAPGYALLQDVQPVAVDSEAVWLDCEKDRAICMQLADAGVLWVGREPVAGHPVLVRRQRGREVAFLAVYTVEGGNVTE